MDRHTKSVQSSKEASKVVSAFVSVALAKQRCNKWIPATYWSKKVSKVLRRKGGDNQQADITPQQLVKDLKRVHGGIEREFTQSDDDRQIYKTIRIIRITTAKVDNDTVSSKRTAQVFLQAIVGCEEELPRNKRELAAFFVNRLVSYNKRKSAQIQPICTTMVEEEELVMTAPRTITPTAFDDEESLGGNGHGQEQSRRTKTTTASESSLATSVHKKVTVTEPTKEMTESLRDRKLTMTGSQRTAPYGELRDLLCKFVNPTKEMTEPYGELLDLLCKLVNPTKEMTESLRDRQPTMTGSQRTAPYGELRDLLCKFVNPKYLDKEDFLVGCQSEEAIKHVEAFAARKARKHHEIFDNGHGDDNDLATRVHDASVYLPCFDKYGLPFRLSVINDLIHCIMKLSQEVPEVLWMVKPGGNKGCGRRLVAVVPSEMNTQKAFNMNAREWLPNLWAALGIEGDNVYFPCFYLLNTLRLECPEAFEDLCRTQSSTAKQFKMDPQRQLAMFEEAQVSYKQARMLRKYFTADKCNPLHSESAIRKLESVSHVKPIFSTFQEHKVKRNAWYLPVDQLVVALLNEQTDKEGVTELHAILSADHGQKAFGVNVTVLLIAGTTVFSERHALVGHIECKHDTTEVLVNSGIIKAINDSFSRLKECLEIPFPVKLLAVGDLAWYSLALGKQSMSGQHCHRCQLMRGEFQNNPSKKGELWTLQLMRETYDRLESGQLNRKVKSQERGLTHPMLIDCIEPDDWICPVLHAVTLFTNTPFKSLQRWIWHRLETVAPELLEARRDVLRTKVTKDECWTELLDVETDLKHLKLELKELKPRGSGVNSVFDDDRHRADFYAVQQQVADHKTEAARRKDIHGIAASALARAKALVRGMETNNKAYGKYHQDLWLSIERMLKAEFNVYCSAYHGGDLEGNQCRLLVSEAPRIMKRIKDLLLAHILSLPPAERVKVATPEEVELHCAGFARLFQYMDLIAHYCYQPYGSMTDADVNDAKRAIKLATSLWKNLMPTVPMKVHAWQHLMDDLEKYRGLKSHHEQEIERAHQDGKKHERRFASLRDFKKKTEAGLRLNLTAVSAGVQAMVADTEAKSKSRKGGRKRKADAISEEEDDRATYLKSILRLPPLTSRFQSLHELEMATYIQQTQ
jgi:hypothetical protein